MTQLYSNLVNYMNSTTYLCLVLAVLKGHTCFTAHLTTSMDPLRSPLCQISCLISNVCSLASIPLFILITENKGGPTHGFRNKESILLDGSVNFLV